MLDAKSDTKAGVRALLRGLEVLRHINAMGSARPGEIAKALNLPRPTVYRLIETLEEAGYLAYSASSNRVRVTPLAASLGDGGNMHSALASQGAPLMAQFASKLIWPLDLSTYENAAMVIQETTHGRSPLSIDRAMVGTRMPMVRTSAGRAYLAFVSDKERALIVEHLIRLGDPADMFFLEGNWLERNIQETRNRGYAIRDAGEFRAKTASIAFPIICDETVLGCISLIWIRSATKTSQMIESVKDNLEDLAKRISDTMARPDTQP